MDKGVNVGLLAMRAANARRAAERMLLTATGNPQAGGGSTPKREPKAAKPKAKAMPARTWRVTLAVEHEGVRQAWACPDLSAPTIKRAIKAARQAWVQLHKGEGAVVAVAGVFDKDLATLPARPV